jgi:hypothetical protein
VRISGFSIRVDILDLALKGRETFPVGIQVHFHAALGDLQDADISGQSVERCGQLAFGVTREKDRATFGEKARSLRKELTVLVNLDEDFVIIPRFFPQFPPGAPQGSVSFNV